MNKPRRILHIGESVKGGAGTHLNELVPLQQAAFGENQVMVLVPKEHVSHLSNIPSKYILTFRRRSRLFGLPSLTIEIIKTLRTTRPDIIHAHSTFAGAIVRILGVFYGIPIVYTPHGWVMDVVKRGLKQQMIGLIERGLSHLCHTIIAVSEYERRRGIAFGINPGKIVTVLNGICPESPSVSPVTWNDTRLKVLFVGRLDRQKGIDILIKAVTGLHNRVSLRIVGDSVVGDKAVDLSAYPHVTSLGWLSFDTVAAHMMACDIVVMPSRWEAFGLVALEAMRLSKPVFASKIGGLPEVIADGETGRLFQPEDAAGLTRILTETELPECQRMGEAGRIRFLNFYTADEMCKKTTAVYEHCLDTKRVRR